MFDFFDNEKNPFLFMMNMMGNESAQEETPNLEASGADPMQFMQQMFLMQMQMMQTMMMMPVKFMQGMAGMMANWNEAAEDAGQPEPAAPQQGGFKLGNLTIPPELLTKLMQMEMSPENLEKLQGVLDFVFEAMPESRDE